MLLLVLCCVLYAAATEALKCADASSKAISFTIFNEIDAKLSFRDVKEVNCDHWSEYGNPEWQFGALEWAGVPANSTEVIVLQKRPSAGGTWTMSVWANGWQQLLTNIRFILYYNNSCSSETRGSPDRFCRDRLEYWTGETWTTGKINFDYNGKPAYLDLDVYYLYWPDGEKFEKKEEYVPLGIKFAYAAEPNSAASALEEGRAMAPASGESAVAGAAGLLVLLFFLL